MADVRRWMYAGAVVVATMLAATDHSFAQPNANNQLPASNTQPVGKSFVVESLIVALLIGGALFAVCRSSRRS